MAAYLITHSLLSSWLHLIRENPYEDLTTEGDPLAEFMLVLKREPTPRTEAIHAIKNAIQYFQNLFVRRYCMATNKRVFTLRLSDEVFDKIGVLATKEHRSITNYIEYVLLKHLEEVEREQGEINLDDPKGD